MNLFKKYKTTQFREMASTVPKFFCLLVLLLPAALGLTPRQRLAARRELNLPLLETYWESYTSFPYNYSTWCQCY